MSDLDDISMESQKPQNLIKEDVISDICNSKTDIPAAIVENGNLPARLPVESAKVSGKSDGITEPDVITEPDLPVEPEVTTEPEVSDGLNPDSDVLELDYGVDGDQLGADQNPPLDGDKGPKPDVREDLKDCRLLWISGVEQTMKANDFRVAFEPYGKVESGKLVMITVKGKKECKGIVTMKTVQGANDVIKHMNGSKMGQFTIQIEKRARDPTDSKKSKSQKAENPNTGPKEAKIIQLNNKRRLSSDRPVPEGLEKVKRSKIGTSEPLENAPDQEEIKRVERQLADMKRAERRLRNRIADSKLDYRKLKKEQDEMTRTRDNLKKDIRSFKDTYEKLKKEESRLRDDKQRDSRELRKLKDENSDIRKDLSDVKSNVQKLKDKIRKIDDESKRESRRDLDSKLRREKEERERLQAERKKLEEDRRKYAEERARLEKEKRNELERNSKRQSPRRQVRHSPARDTRRSPPKTTQKPQSARSRLGERPRSPVDKSANQNFDRNRRSPIRRPNNPRPSRNRSPPRRGRDSDRQDYKDGRSDQRDNRKDQKNDSKGSAWGSPDTKSWGDTKSSGWGDSQKSTGWGGDSQKSSGWGDSGNNAQKRSGSSGGWGEPEVKEKVSSWGDEGASSWEQKTWGGPPAENNRNVTYSNDRTMIVSKPADNSGWGQTRHDVGRKGSKPYV